MPPLKGRRNVVVPDTLWTRIARHSKTAYGTVNHSKIVRLAVGEYLARKEKSQAKKKAR